MFKRAKQRFLAKRRNLFVLTSAFVLHHPIDVISYLSLPGDVRFGKSRSITSQFHSRSLANCQIAAWVQGRNHRWNCNIQKKENGWEKWLYNCRHITIFSFLSFFPFFFHVLELYTSQGWMENYIDTIPTYTYSLQGHLENLVNFSFRNGIFLIDFSYELFYT